MSKYTRVVTTQPTLGDEDDILESLQNIPSNFDLALNGRASRYLSSSPLGTRNGRYVSPNPPKDFDNSLLNPDALRRISISSIPSHHIDSRGVSPYPATSIEDARTKTWRSSLSDFWGRNQGLLLVTISQLFGALMNVTTRLLELEGDGMHPFQILFVRMGITAAFCCIWMHYKKVEDFPLGAKGIRRLLVARGLTGFFGIYGMYYSLQYLPVADAVVITFLAPSVASYGCYLFLKEPFPKTAQYASLVSLLGVVLIAQPLGFLTSSSKDAPGSAAANSTSSVTGEDFPTPTETQRLSAVAVALLGVLGSAGAYTSIRHIGTRAHPLLSVNYFAVWCTVVSTLSLSLAQPLHLSTTLSFSLPAGIRQWSMLLFLGICGFVMQFLLTKGLGTGGKDGGRGMNMIYTNMLFAMGLDRVVFGVVPGWWSLGGSGLILGSAVWVAIAKGREEKDDLGEVGALDEEMGMLVIGEDAEVEVERRGRINESVR